MNDKLYHMSVSITASCGNRCIPAPSVLALVVRAWVRHTHSLLSVGHPFFM